MKLIYVTKPEHLHPAQNTRADEVQTKAKGKSVYEEKGRMRETKAKPLKLRVL